MINISFAPKSHAQPFLLAASPSHTLEKLARSPPGACRLDPVAADAAPQAHYRYIMNNPSIKKYQEKKALARGEEVVVVMQQV